MTDVHSGDTVRVHYTLTLTDGTPVESSRGKDPLQFQVGAGQIIPGVERQVDGMTVGETRTVTVPAAEAYGPRDEAGVQTVPRSAIPAEVSIGDRLQAKTPDGREVPLTVAGMDEENVTVDANHPLAGRDLVFEIEVLEVV
ncbi:FKBP-type peptidyl-prolyl cis-trans isomerase [Aquibium oceanicum]|uniref:Peptidyl-prolyl cis-trans isomerase n=1 Tax=Aquibium oceanicum TaxID=1670800 RepID=A0A1L3SXS7_9HYPH|nr:peptidylprolyl isomerase [Aquibium oceanicum]APH74237.1 peptidylprolyl isomerase [Aquibium oceanicum]